MRRLYTYLVGALLLAPFMGQAQQSCTPHTQVSNSFENGLFMEVGGQELADDFTLSVNTLSFTANQLTVNVMTQGGVDSFDVTFREDNGDMPGAVYGSPITGLVPTSQDIIGTAFGFDVHEVVLDLPAPVEFTGTGTEEVKYWLQLAATPTSTGSQVAWETTSQNVQGNFYFFNNENVEDWTIGDGDAVFSITGDCEYVAGCLAPTNMTAANLTSESADVTWTAEGPATEWSVEYGLAGFTQGNGTVTTVTTNSVSLTDLEMMTAYDVYVQSLCEGDQSAWVGPYTFSTTDSYCTTPVTTIEPITYVEFAGLANTTPADPNVVNPNEYFLDQQASVIQGETYPVALEGNTAGDWTNSFTVFIDWNQDGEFNSDDERYEIGTIVNSTGEDGQQATADIAVPPSAATGTTRMRVVKMYSASGDFIPTACESVGFGQTHDYSVTVEQFSGCTPHIQVSNGFENASFMEAGGQLVANDFIVSEQTTLFTADNVTANLMTESTLDSVDIYFFSDNAGMPGAAFGTPITGLVPTSQEIIGEAFGFDVREVVMDFAAMDFPGTGTSDVTYWVQLVAHPTTEGTSVAWETTTAGIIGQPMFYDNENTSEWTEGDSDGVFSISGECEFIEGCFAPSNILASDLTTNSTEIVWVQNGNVDHWVVEYGEEGFAQGTGTEITTYTPNAMIEGLDHFSTYDVYVKAICDDVNESAWTGPASFTTLDIYCTITLLGDIEPITYVEFAGIENTTSPDVNGTPSQEFFLDQMATVDRGETYTITLEGNTNGNFANSFTVFIDWNQDGEFDIETERYESGIIVNSTGVDGQQATGSIEVPGTAALGETRMRVTKMYTDAEDYAADACADVIYGQTEDYTVVVEQGEYPGVDCTPHAQVSNEFENGLFMEAGGQNLADDFTVSTNTQSFSAHGMTLNAMSQGGIESFDVIFYEDNNGAPGAAYGAGVSNLVPTSQEVIGTAFGFDVHEVVLDFPTAIEFAGTGTGPVTYWVQLIAYPTDAESQVAWEATTADVMGSFYHFDNENTTGWTAGTGDLVFSISGQCTMVEGCLAPVDLMASNITTDAADISWTQEDGATEWVVEYGLEGFEQGTGTEITTTSPETTLSALESLTGYDVYVKAICGEGDESLWAGPMNFVTADTYCAGATNFAVEPITYVEFAGISNTSSADPSSAPHEYFMDQTAELEAGGSYEIVVEGYTGGPYMNSFTAFFDWNQDGEFNNDDERYDIGFIENSTGEDGQQATATIDVPSGITLGTTRMRVVKTYTFEDSYPTDACEAVDYGQFEDYNVEVGPESVVDFDKYAFAYGPNPTANTINLSSDVIIERVAFYNVLGQKVMMEQVNSTSPQLNLSTLENGAYFMEVIINGERQTFKIVKQ